jgi:hypothetical protein
MNSIFSLILFTMLLITHAALAAEPRCQALAGFNPQKLIQFLKDGQTASPGPNCVEYALRSLGDSKMQEAIPVLVAYLDFERPETEMEKLGMGGALGTIGNDFPAVFALTQMGRASLPALVQVVESGTSSTKAHKNGIYAIMKIFHRGAAGIQFLTHSAATAESTDAQSRLSAAASEAVNWCTASERPTCESAASGASEVDDPINDTFWSVKPVGFSYNASRFP